MTEYQKSIDLTGQKFERLLVIDRSGNKSSSGGIKYNCRCDCGNKSEVEANRLRTFKTKSCGCLQKETATKHGEWNSPTYISWKQMLYRSQVLNIKIIMVEELRFAINGKINVMDLKVFYKIWDINLH